MYFCLRKHLKKKTNIHYHLHWITLINFRNFQKIKDIIKLTHTSDINLCAYICLSVYLCLIVFELVSILILVVFLYCSGSNLRRPQFNWISKYIKYNLKVCIFNYIFHVCISILFTYDFVSVLFLFTFYISLKFIITKIILWDIFLQTFSTFLAGNVLQRLLLLFYW